LNPLFDLTGKVAAVTGSTRGIGRAAALELASAGAAVVVSSEDGELSRERASCLSANGNTALGVPCDVRRSQDLTELVQTTLDRFGRLDILVANARITLSEGPLAGVTDADYQTMMEVNDAHRDMGDGTVADKMQATKRCIVRPRFPHLAYRVLAGSSHKVVSGDIMSH
jgi:dehydrogenase/reductase SDR family member 4